MTQEHADIAPVIDISPFFGGTPGAKADVARSFGAACEYTGFFMITGHGVDRRLLDETISLTRAFFALPEAEKMRTLPVAKRGTGYLPMESVALAASLGGAPIPDLKEGYVLRPLPEARKNSTGGTWEDAFRETAWPSAVPGFREAWLSYYEAMDSLSASLMRIAALALDMPETCFASKFERHCSALTARNYPAVQREPKPGQLRAGAHTDYGAITILWKDEGSGSLQVFDKAGKWRDVIPEPNAFVINIGDLLAQWTNDRWVSTLHRVTMPAEAERGFARLSIPFFYQPDPDALIETIPSCIDEEHPLKYAPVLAGEHIAEKQGRHLIQA